MIPEGFGIHELAPDDAPGLAAAYARNRVYLEPWEPTRSEGFFTEAGQAAAVDEQLTTVTAGLTAAWVLTHADDIVGRVNLHNIVRGVLCSASVGYWVDAGHQGRGLATGAVEVACARAEGLGLHRVQAGTLPHNLASQRVLERSGFDYYGTADRYLYIAGAWQAHRLYQRILNDEPL